MSLSPRHALYVGWVAGIAYLNGVRLDPVVGDDGDFTDRLSVRLSTSRLAIAQTVTITFVVPPPPGWKPEFEELQ